MKKHLKDTKVINNTIELEIDKNTKIKFNVKDLFVVGEENKNFKPGYEGDKLFNVIVHFNYKNKDILRVYSTHRSDFKYFFNIIFDNVNINYRDKAINLLKQDTWTIEDNGSIKTTINDEKKEGSEALRELLSENEINDFNIYSGQTTSLEQDLLFKI